jgi:hypothetical protein
MYLGASKQTTEAIVINWLAEIEASGEFDAKSFRLAGSFEKGVEREYRRKQAYPLHCDEQSVAR